DVLNSLEHDTTLRSDIKVYNCGEVARSLLENGSSLISAVSITCTEDVIISDSGGITAVPDGFGIIRDNKLCCYLTLDQSKVTNLMMNEVTSGIAILHPREDLTVSMDVKSAKTKPLPVEGGIFLDIHINLGINEISRSEKVDQKLIEQLQEEDRKNVSGWIDEVLAIQKKLGSRFLGFDEEIVGYNVEVIVSQSYDIVDSPES
ncbi:hypothetical protein LJC01_02890, partial [Clostridiaceae bacterium OttesenSCG-928-D20]|nr:hypothetical protein [Clostridiaceae bacterium OttesenSCG-928-D20]